MIRFLKHSEIDKDRWNRALQGSINATIFADFDLLSISSPGWCALVEDDYKAIMPLPVRSKLSVKYIYTPFFSNRLGIFSADNIDAEKVMDFEKAIPKKFRQIDLILNRQNPTELIENQVITMVSHLLSLNQPYENIAANYSQNTKRNIKSAQKQGLEYRENVSIKQIITLFKKNRGRKKYVHYKPADYVILMKMSRNAYSRGLLDCVGVFNGNKMIAGALFLKDDQRTWFWFSGRDNQYADKKPMFFLIDEYIKAHAQEPLLLDFNGSMNENVARMYKSFGGKMYNYKMICHTQDFYLGKLIKLYRSILHP